MAEGRLTVNDGDPALVVVPVGRLGCGVFDEAADLDEVVSEDAVSAPDAGAGEAVEVCSGKPEVTLGAADPSFTARCAIAPSS